MHLEALERGVQQRWYVVRPAVERVPSEQLQQLLARGHRLARGGIARARLTDVGPQVHGDAGSRVAEHALCARLLDAGGRHRGHQRLRRQPLALEQVFAHRTGHHGHHDVVHGAAETRLDRLDVLERESHGREIALPAERAVEGGRRHLVRQRDVERPGTVAQIDAVQGADGLPDQRRQSTDVHDLVAQRIAHQPPRGRYCFRLPWHRHGRGRFVPARSQHALELVDRRLPVGDRVVQFHHEGDATALEPLDHPHFPQGPRMIERVGGNLRDHLVELRGTARCRRREPVHVQVDVEIGVLDDYRMVQAERHRDDAAPEAGNHVQRCADRLLDLVQARGGPGGVSPDEDLQRVHRRGLRFLVQEIRIVSAQPKHPATSARAAIAFSARTAPCAH